MIRIATVADIEQMLAIYAPYVENTAFSFEYVPPTLEEFTERFLRYTRQCPWLVWEEDGKVLGYAYGSLPFERAAYAWCGEVSIYLAPKIQRKGIGQKLYAALEDIMWRQGYRVLYALITSENRGSLAFHEKAGYRYCTEFADCGLKFGRWLGVIWMEKRSKIVGTPNSTPVPWTFIVNDDRKLSNDLGIFPLF